ncbi:hypothetical protein CUMW_241860 [Citrus unshiu]|uniref:Uncharacterized protein n=1 Tax=Citrus unshiu TaxID=55188 RepID=A0A2H5QLP0_CITUN|nr:hypothetical protein CUMW_241860 [Citrus unshiu]
MAEEKIQIELEMQNPSVKEKHKKAKDKRAKNVYNHRLGHTGYGGMLYRKKKESGVSEQEIDRSEAWLMARADRDGKYSDVMPIVEKIIDNDEQSPKTLGKQKADFPSGKSTLKSVKSKMKDTPTIIS